MNLLGLSISKATPNHLEHIAKLTVGMAVVEAVNDELAKSNASLREELRRRRREVRKDQAEIAHAIAERAEVYQKRFASLTDEQRSKAMRRAACGRGA